MSHYLKLVMDAIFGRRNFGNEIVWHYRRWTAGNRHFQRMHDVILRYFITDEFIFNLQFEPYSKNTIHGQISVDGKTDLSSSRDLKKGTKMNDVWQIPYLHSQSKERTGYRTQKPLDLLRRIIKASSNRGDMVLDPFCGCATTCIAAEDLQRQWVGIDIGEKAAELVQMRMKENLGMFYDGVHRTDIPQRTDLGKLPSYKSHKQALYGFQGGHCNGCSEHFKPQNLTVDHIIPRSGGGTDHIGNLQLLCGHCNSVKGNRGMEYLIARLENGNTGKGY